MVSANRTARPRFSAIVSSFIEMMDGAQKDYAWNLNEAHRMEELTQDYLHALELEGLNYKERAKVATQLAKCRQTRRECKDTVEILEPLIQFLEDERGKKLLNLMREVLGSTRKVEKRMETRTYYPRVLERREQFGKTDT